MPGPTDLQTALVVVNAESIDAHALHAQLQAPLQRVNQLLVACDGLHIDGFRLGLQQEQQEWGCMLEQKQTRRNRGRQVSALNVGAPALLAFQIHPPNLWPSILRMWRFSA